MPSDLTRGWIASCLKDNLQLCRNRQLAIRFLHLVDQYYLSERTVQFYAGMLNISRAYLRQVGQKALTRSPSCCIGLRTAMEAAWLLLQEPSTTIREIAYRTGFEDADYFSRFFKKYMKVTPGEYREINGLL